MALSKSLKQEANEALDSETCDCGRKKQKGQSFCARCYFSLPDAIQRGLYRTFTEGYVEAWDEARDWLRGERKAGK